MTIARGIGASAVALACLAPVAGASPGRPAWSLGLSCGTTRFDAHLADYRWNLAPRPAWGAQAGVARGRLGLALRASVSAATQHVDAAASPPEAAVRATTLDLAAEAEVARPLGFGLLARASGGRLALAYAPDRVEMNAGGSATTVELPPLRAWSWGAGAALRRALGPGWTATLAVERQAFALDTAHRAGPSVSYARESFGNWNGRLELARLIGTP